MNIDIIIPVYRAKSTIKRLLYSIVYQKGSKDFNIYLINDGDEDSYAEEVNMFKDYLSIKELVLPENCGPGVARQYGIDNSNSKYIIFIDADDYLYSPYSLLLMSQKITFDNSDLLISNFIYQRDNEVSIKKNNPVWLHGKMYRREFLEKHNIRFNSTRANEDNGFNRLILLCEPKISWLDEVTYVYSENSNSITRRNNREYKFTGLEWYTYNMAWAMNEAIKRNVKFVEIGRLSLNVLVSMYFYYLELYDQYNVSKIIEWSRPIGDLYVKYGNISIDKNRFDSLIKDYLVSQYKNKKIGFIINFEDFLLLVGVDIND